MTTPSPKGPNFRSPDGKLFVVRCEACGRENWAPAVATGLCAWCGWQEARKERKGERR